MGQNNTSNNNDSLNSSTISIHESSPFDIGSVRYDLSIYYCSF
jgi:hypothetical protein